VWKAPNVAALELREIGRRLNELVHTGAEEKNRFHAKKAAGISTTVINDVKAHVAQIRKRVKEIEKSAVAVIRGDAELREKL
jgi:hypothetical protein